MIDDRLGYKFYDLISKDKKANNLIIRLNEYGDLLMFGGAVREFYDNRFLKIPRDFDIVIDKKYEDDLNFKYIFHDLNYTQNRFGGYKVDTGKLRFDIWELENTWAFKEKKIECSRNDYKHRLQDTVFLNVDSVVYNFATSEVYCKEYCRAMKNKKIDVVLEDNPFKELNFIRAILLKKKYGMEFSERLNKIFCDVVKDSTDYVDRIYEIQYDHYKEYRLTKNDIRIEIEKLLS